MNRGEIITRLGLILIALSVGMEIYQKGFFGIIISNIELMIMGFTISSIGLYFYHLEKNHPEEMEESK